MGLQGGFAVQRQRKLVVPASIDLTFDKIDREWWSVGQFMGDGYRFVPKNAIIDHLPDESPFCRHFRVKRFSEQRQSPSAGAADGSLHKHRCSSIENRPKSDKTQDEARGSGSNHYVTGERNTDSGSRRRTIYSNNDRDTQ